MNSDEATILQGLGPIDPGFLSESIGSLMTPSPHTVLDSLSVAETIESMLDADIGSVLVVDKQGNLRGIFTERDVLKKVVASKSDLNKMQISSVMTADPSTEKAASSIAVAIYKMTRGGFRHLPIVDEHNRAVGMVSIKDVTERISRELLKGVFQNAFG